MNRHATGFTWTYLPSGPGQIVLRHIDLQYMFSKHSAAIKLTHANRQKQGQQSNNNNTNNTQSLSVLD